MDDIAAGLLEELNCKTVFTIPIFGGIEIAESVVVTWIIMAIMVLISFLMTRNLKIDHISKRQAVVETIVTKLSSMVTDMVGEHGKPYVPYLATILVYIGIANIIGLFGFKSPTKDLNVTVALAFVSIVLIEVSGVVAKGGKRWLHSFVEPVPIVAPLNVLDMFTRPLSLCMRLFGNVLGACVIMCMIKQLVPVALPVVFSLYFDLFDGLLQAYVFVFLTSLYIREATE
jgi:F-type H+-transporting ATPase subunit a